MIEEDTDAFNLIPGGNTNVCVKCKRTQTFYSELQIMKVVHEKVGQDYLNNLFYVDPHRESEDKFYTHIPCGHRYCEQCRSDLFESTSRDIRCTECKISLQKITNSEAWSEKTKEQLQIDRELIKRNLVLENYYLSLSDFNNDEKLYNDYLEKVEDIICKSSKTKESIENLLKLQEEINLPESIYVYPKFSDTGIIVNNNLRNLLKEVKLAFEETPNLTIEIIGHTDNVGNASDNYRMGLQYAREVRWYLISKGNFKSSAIKASSKGELDPIDTNNSKRGRQANRRIEVVYNYNE